MRRASFLLLFIVLSSLLAWTAPVRAAGTSYYTVKFNGVSTYVDAGNSSVLNFGTGSFSVVFLVKLDGKSQSVHVIAEKRTNAYYTGAPGWNIFISNAGYLLVGISDGPHHISDSTQIGNTPLAYDRYYLVAVVFNRTAGIIQAYVDGKYTGAVDISAINGSVDNTADLWIGRGHYASTTRLLNGTLALFLIYNRALSASEIQAIYADPLDPPTTGLVLWYAPDSVDPANNVWTDKSGNGNNGSISGATYVRVSIPTLSVYDIENNSEIPISNVSVSLIANNTTISLIPSLLTLPWNSTVTLNVSASGYLPRTLTVPSIIQTLSVYLQPAPSNATANNSLTPPTETITPVFRLSENYNDHGLWGGRLGIYFLTGNWSEGFRRFWTLNPMFELVLPLLFAFGLILSSYLITRKPLVPVGVTAVTASFFGMLGVPLQLSVATPLAALFIFWIVYTLWDFYKKFERS